MSSTTEDARRWCKDNVQTVCKAINVGIGIIAFAYIVGKIIDNYNEVKVQCEVQGVKVDLTLKKKGSTF